MQFTTPENRTPEKYNLCDLLSPKPNLRMAYWASDLHERGLHERGQVYRPPDDFDPERHIKSEDFNLPPLGYILRYC